MKTKVKPVILYFSLIIIGFLLVNTSFNSQSFKEEITSIKPSQGTITMYE